MSENRLEALIDDYLAHCLSEGRRRNTVENAYGYPLHHVFLPWCSREGIDQPSQLTRRAMERYQGEMLAKGGARGPLSPSTVHSYVRVVNQMLVWARDPESGVEGHVPDGKVRLPKLGRPVKDILSRVEVEHMEDTARTERDKLIIRVFGDTGMRVQERQDHVAASRSAWTSIGRDHLIAELDREFTGTPPSRGGRRPGRRRLRVDR